MATKIFVNLPVKDLDRSVAFFTQLGFSFDPQFTDGNATCMIVGENIFVMLLVAQFFGTFTGKPVADAMKTTEVILALTVDSKERADDMVSRAIEAGGVESLPLQDHGWMYQRSFQDIDGHLWEVSWMDPDGIPQP